MIVDGLYHSAGNLQRDLVNERTTKMPFNPQNALTCININVEKLSQIPQNIAELTQTINHYADFCEKPKI